MGRPPIGDRAMTAGERQRRYLTRLRKRAELGAQRPAPTPPQPAEDVVRIAHFKEYPGQIMECLCPSLTAAALRTMRAVIDRHLTGRVMMPARPARELDARDELNDDELG